MTVTPTPGSYTLTINSLTGGGGNVSVSATDLNNRKDCNSISGFYGNNSVGSTGDDTNSQCKRVYANNPTVDLNFSASNSNYLFAYWADTCSTMNSAIDFSCTGKTSSLTSLTMDGDKTIYVSFTCPNGNCRGGCTANSCPTKIPTTNETDGSCNNSSNNSCNAGELEDINDSSTQYLWECVGSQSIASCSLNIPPSVVIDGSCGNSVNACDTGSFSDIADTSTNYLWDCVGSNGGITAYSCSYPISNPSSSSSSSATPSSSSSSSSSSTPTDPGTVNLTVIQKGSGSGAVSLKHMGSLDGYDNGFDTNVPGSSPWGLAKDWIFQITATPSSGSYLSSVSGGGCSDSPCAITMNTDKTVTATFNDSSGGTGGGGSGGGSGGGGSAVKAYISARDTVVTDGNSTVVTWTSDNAASCSHTDDSGLGSGSYKDTGWVSASDTTSGSYTTANFTTSDGARTYKVTCKNGSQEAKAEVPVSVGSDYTGTPSVNMWADPQNIGYKKRPRSSGSAAMFSTIVCCIRCQTL